MPSKNSNNKKNFLQVRRRYLSVELESRQFFMAALGILALALVLLILAYGQEHRRVLVPASIPATAMKLQQPVSMGQVEITVEKVILTDGEGTFIAPIGKKYAVLSVNIRNKSDKPIQVLPASDTYMKTDAGDVAYLSPYGLSEPYRAGELSPGERQKGELSYLITSDTSYKFYVDAIWSGGVIPFKAVD